jgi:hypothetical protein
MKSNFLNLDKNGHPRSAGAGIVSLLGCMTMRLGGFSLALWLVLCSRSIEFGLLFCGRITLQSLGGVSLLSLVVSLCISRPFLAGRCILPLDNELVSFVSKKTTKQNKVDILSNVFSEWEKPTIGASKWHSLQNLLSCIGPGCWLLPLRKNTDPKILVV